MTKRLSLPVPNCPFCDFLLVDVSNALDPESPLVLKCAKCERSFRPRLEDVAEAYAQVQEEAPDFPTMRKLIPDDHIQLLQLETRAQLIDKDIKRLTAELKMATFELHHFGMAMSQKYATHLGHIRSATGQIARPAVVTQQVRVRQVEPLQPNPAVELGNPFAEQGGRENFEVIATHEPPLDNSGR